MPKNERNLRIVIGSLEIGGAEKHLSYVLPKLKQLGWNIRVISLSPHVTLLPIFKDAGIKVKYPRLYLKNKFVPLLISRSFNLLSSFSLLCLDFIFDRKSITNFFLPEAYVIGMWAAIITGNNAPRIMSRRCLNIYQQKRPLIKLLELKLHKYCQYITGNSKAVMDQLQQEHIPRDKLFLIYNGIDITKFKVSNRKKNKIKFVIVANLHPYKGHKDLLKALALINPKLMAKNISWELTCIGKDVFGYQQELTKIAFEHGINKNITWLNDGKVNPHEVLAKFDIGILCSHQEGFANAILEKMAAGLATVATDVGGNSEAVTHNQTGFIVPPHAPEKLAKALLILCLNDELRNQMGKSARQRIEMLFNLDTCVEEYQKLYTHCR